MREILYIRLPSGLPEHSTEPVEFGLAAADRPGMVAAYHAPLERALDHGASRRIIVLVPGADVRLSSVTVPARQPAKVLQAAPYLLEDQLAEDIETLHFALGPRQADGSHPVAVVGLQRMEQWLAPFRARGLRPEALVPETLALPWDAEDARWSALSEPGQITVRNGAYAGFCCDPDDLATYLQLADPERSRPLRLLALSQAGADYSRIDWPLELLPGFHRGVEALGRNLRLDQTINLLQGAYSQSQDLERYWKPWRAAAVLAAAWALAAAAYYGAETYQLAAAVQQQEQANLERFQQLFPSETRIVDLRAQLDQQLRALKGGPSSDGLFPLLETLTQALGANPGLTLQGLRYQDGALFLTLRASDLQVVERTREWFAAQRAAALEVQSADAGTEGVQVRLKLTRS